MHSFGNITYSDEKNSITENFNFQYVKSTKNICFMNLLAILHLQTLILSYMFLFAFIPHYPSTSLTQTSNGMVQEAQKWI